jgi:hypothetical protein
VRNAKVVFVALVLVLGIASDQLAQEEPYVPKWVSTCSNSPACCTHCDLPLSNCAEECPDAQFTPTVHRDHDYHKLWVTLGVSGATGCEWGTYSSNITFAIRCMCFVLDEEGNPTLVDCSDGNHIHAAPSGVATCPVNSPSNPVPSPDPPAEQDQLYQAYISSDNGGHVPFYYIMFHSATHGGCGSCPGTFAPGAKDWTEL